RKSFSSFKSCPMQLSLRMAKILIMARVSYATLITRLNMYLRWMIRKDKNGVDFGIWDSISPSILSCPLDVHSGNVARKLGLLKRKQNDSRAVAELDRMLRSFDEKDPVKYDFALFGLGVFEKF
ncbi:MAG TPA: DUF2400 family protein, partial [Candidatus Cloacimonadota bacterium]|nr:DUF2400 family protein [Candidatus Cloacimonadota bacterium]